MTASGKMRRYLAFCGLSVLAALAVGGLSASSSNYPGAEFETVPPGEQEEIDELVDLTVELQDKRKPSQDGKLFRGVHAKSHGCVKAEFAINRDIAETYQVGLFAEPGKVHEAWIRFSNASVLREDDLKANDEGIRQNGSRGMAIKVMDVDGEMLDTDDGRNNQDFLMINTPEFAFANVRDYLRLNRILKRSEKGDVGKPFFFPAAVKDPRLPDAVRAQLQAAIDNDPLLKDLTPPDLARTFASAQVVGKIESQTVRNPMQVRYFGAAPFLFGDGRVMRFSAAPCGTPPVQAPFANITPDNPSPNYLREALTATMSGQEAVCFDFKVKVRSAGSDGLNIEDATTSWPETAGDWEEVDLAKVTIPAPQMPDTPEAREQCERLAFNPWHSLAAHQPLGGINRLRRGVYSASAKNRRAKGY